MSREMEKHLRDALEAVAKSHLLVAQAQAHFEDVLQKLLREVGPDRALDHLTVIGLDVAGKHWGSDVVNELIRDGFKVKNGKTSKADA